jgi:hypothetical protein
MKTQGCNLYENALALADTLSEINCTAKRMERLCLEATAACYQVKDAISSLALLHHPEYFEIYEATFHPRLGILVSIRMPNGREVHAVFFRLSSLVQQRYFELVYRLLKDLSVRQEKPAAIRVPPLNDNPIPAAANSPSNNGPASAYRVKRLPFNPPKIQG